MADAAHATLLELSNSEFVPRHAVATDSALLFLDDPRHFAHFRPAKVRLAVPIHDLSLDEHDEHTLLLESPHLPAPVVVASQHHGGISAWAAALRQRGARDVTPPQWQQRQLLQPPPPPPPPPRGEAAPARLAELEEALEAAQAELDSARAALAEARHQAELDSASALVASESAARAAALMDEVLSHPSVGGLMREAAALLKV